MWQNWLEYSKNLISSRFWEAHDIVTSKCYDSPPSSPEMRNSSLNHQLLPADAIHILGIHKRAGDPLGVTFRAENNDLLIARILHGGMIDRQGLLHVGDIIRESMDMRLETIQRNYKSCGKILVEVLH